MRLGEVKMLVLGLTNRCNGACRMCWHSNVVKCKSVELGDRVYSEVRDKLFKHISVLNLAGGGECVLHSRIENILADCAKYRFRTKITSNFAAIGDRHRELLKDLDVEFVVSLDASNKKLQEFLRTGCNYDIIIENIKFFKKHGKKIEFQSTICNYNFYDMKNIVALAADLGVGLVKFQEVQFLVNLDMPYKIDKPPHDIEYLDSVFGKLGTTVSILFEFYHKPSNKFPSNRYEFYKLWRKLFRTNELCPNTVDLIKIQEDGKVHCCCLPKSKCMGDLNETSLEGILGSDAFEENRRVCNCYFREKLMSAVNRFGKDAE